MALNTYSDNGIESLAIAIVQQASFDYVNALRKLRAYSHNKKDRDFIAAQKTVTECELFFNGPLFAAICPNISAEWMIEKLRKEALTPGSRVAGLARRYGKT